MDESGFAARVRDGESVLGAWSVVGHPVVAEVLAAEGFDFVVLDGEHSENTIADLAGGIRAIEAASGGAAAVVRASGNDRAEIRRLLDLGPEGIVIPQVESAEEARAAVSATRYPPDGVRGVAGGRASSYGDQIGDYVANADAEIATILQVETRGVVDEIETVVGINGLDALFIGPADLSARLGNFGGFEDEGFQEAVARVIEVANSAGVPVGTIATGLDQIETRMDEWGVDFVAVGTDVGYLKAGAQAYLDSV